MKLPAVQGLIRRRMLINFRVDAAVIQRELPPPFRPKLLGDAAVAGLCLIRLEQLRPEGCALPVGLHSENAAHRIAVVWSDERGEEHEGVYIPRRDTDSLFTHLAGGRLFSGEHHRAHFVVRDEGGRIDFGMQSEDGEAVVHLRAREATSLPATSRFATMDAASAFFESGALGYAARRHGDRLDGIRLQTHQWHVDPLDVDSVYVSYYADTARYPAGSVTFDSALIMRNIPHAWQSEPEFTGRRAIIGDVAPSRPLPGSR